MKFIIRIFKAIDNWLDKQIQEHKLMVEGCPKCPMNNIEIVSKTTAKCKSCWHEFEIKH